MVVILVLLIYYYYYYTESQKKPGTHIMPRNSRKCGPILIILLLRILG